MKVRDFSKLYFAFLLLHLATIHQPESQLLHYLSKPLLLVSLLIFFIYRTEQSANQSKWWIAAALAFSLLGDMLLMWKGEVFFLTGMGAFALAHLSYISFFMKGHKAQNSLVSLAGSLVLVAFSLYALNEWINLPPTLTIPVNVYGVILGLNFIASTKFGLSGDKSLLLVPIGVLLFMTSDLLLAYQKFNMVLPDKYLQMGVMVSYGAAQFLIVTGVLTYLENGKSDQVEG